MKIHRETLEAALMDAIRERERYEMGRSAESSYLDTLKQMKDAVARGEWLWPTVLQSGSEVANDR